MISVSLPVPPVNFDKQVRIPGQAFLAVNPHPSNSDWQDHRYWSRIHGYLYAQVKGICFYCASFTPRRTHPGNSLDHTSIDHFVPKSIGSHAQAYEWSNFRLCRARLNNRKSDYQDVLDPCVIQDRWFQMNFSTFAILPNPTLSLSDRKKVEDSIARLELNDDDDYVNERARVVFAYVDNKISFKELSKRYPFIAMEMTSQDFDTTYMVNYKIVLANPKSRGALISQGWLC